MKLESLWSSGSIFRKNGILFVLFAVVLCVLWQSSAPGADFYRYLDWGYAVSSGDFWRIGSETRSPLGLPLTQWSHGPGVLYSTIHLLSLRLLSLESAAALAGAAFSAVGAIALYFVLLHAARRDRKLAAIGTFCFGLFGTHLGFSLLHQSSETLTIAAVSLTAWLWTRHDVDRLDTTLAFGSAVALLVTFRVQLAIYAVPCLVVIAANMLQKRLSVRRLISHAGVAALPVGIALAETLLTQRWATGHLFQSPYVFGDGGFKSMDLMRPEFASILYGPFHGLLVYHPFYALGLVAASALAFGSAVPAAERWFWRAVILVLGFHVVIQAGWYCWWLGMGTFGMRGLGTMAVPCVAAFVRWVERLDERRSNLALWVATGCCLWSGLLMFQGNTAFYSYFAILQAQRDQIQSTRWVTWLVGAVAVAVGFWTLKTLFRGRTSDPGNPMPVWVGILLSAVVALGAFEFGRLTWRVESGLKGQRPAASEREFRYEAPFQVEEVLATYSEYLNIPGYALQREALRAFLKRAVWNIQ